MSATRRIWVGLFVIGGFFLFALGLFWIGDRRLLFSESIELETQFANLSGLKIGSKVMVSGMDAGEVLAIQAPSRPTDKFRVRFRVLSRFRPILRADSVASIQVEGLVGSKVLQVDAGTEAAARVESGATIQSREPVEIGQIIQQARDTLDRVGAVVDDVQKHVVVTVDTMTELGETARKVVDEVGADAGRLLKTTGRVANEVDSLVDGVSKGRGLVGKLLTDDKLYTRVDSAVKDVQAIAANASRTSEDVKKVVADIESRKPGEVFEKTADNVQEATAQLKKMLAELKPPGEPGDRGLLADVRDSLDNTREATSDLAENMEALKRNWFFRGYFNKRGFFDLDSVSLDDYRQGKIATDRDREATWLHARELFRPDQAGRETLSDAGLKKLGETMASYLRYAPNTLLIVEGYAGQGSDSEQFLLSRDRAHLVRRYLIDRFGLKSNFVGAVPMGSVASSGPKGEPWEGVSVVFFPEKKKK